MSGRLNIWLDKGDILALQKDLDRLGRNFKDRRKAIRRGLKTAGKPIEISTRKEANQAIEDVGEMARSFAWNSRVRRDTIHVWLQSRVKHGGYLTKIFEDGTDERFTKKGWWTGAIVEGGRRKKVKTKFIQRSFNRHSERVAKNIVVEVSNSVDRIIKKSRKLSKKNGL